MGYYNMKRRGHTNVSGDPNYIAVFDRMRELEYTIVQAKVIAREAVELMKQDSTLAFEMAIRRVLE